MQLALGWGGVTLPLTLSIKSAAKIMLIERMKDQMSKYVSLYQKHNFLRRIWKDFAKGCMEKTRWWLEATSKIGCASMLSCRSSPQWSTIAARYTNFKLKIECEDLRILGRRQLKGSDVLFCSTKNTLCEMNVWQSRCVRWHVNPCRWINQSNHLPSCLHFRTEHWRRPRCTRGTRSPKL